MISSALLAAAAGGGGSTGAAFSPVARGGGQPATPSPAASCELPQAAVAVAPGAGGRERSPKPSPKPSPRVSTGSAKPGATQTLATLTAHARACESCRVVSTWAVDRCHALMPIKFVSPACVTGLNSLICVYPHIAFQLPSCCE